jgi:hypothetical protein
MGLNLEVLLKSPNIARELGSFIIIFLPVFLLIFITFFIILFSYFF